MATIFGDTLRTSMQQYSFEVDTESIEEDLSCNICKRLMIDAYQTPCGCQYCRECLMKYLAGGDKYCSGSKKECTEETLVLEQNVFKSGMLNRKILKARVRCPNQSCVSLVEFGQMEEHLRLCSEQLIECPYSIIGCDSEGTSKDRIESHLHNYAYTHSQLLLELIYNLKNEVNGLKDDFQASRLEISSLKEELRIKEIQMNEQMEVIKKVEIEMENLRNEVQEDGIYEKPYSVQEIKNRAVILERKEFKRKQMDDVMEEMGILKKEVVEVTEYLSNVKDSFATLQGESTYCLNETDSTALIVDRFSARKAAKEKIISPFFYSHPNGYKLRLRIYPGGRDEGRGTHLSVVFVLCKGEYDDTLPWPCKHTFVISIINQRSNDKHVSVIHKYSTTKGNSAQSFNKPIKKDNIGYGYSKFISNFELHSIPGLVENDSVYIKCAVSTRHDSFS